MLDFALRAIDCGWRVCYRGDILVRHKASPERRVEWSGDRWFHFVRNRVYIARKWDASWPELAPRYAAYTVKGLRNGLARQTVRALLAAMLLSPSMPTTRLSPSAIADRALPTPVS